MINLSLRTARPVRIACALLLSATLACVELPEVVGLDGSGVGPPPPSAEVFTSPDPGQDECAAGGCLGDPCEGDDDCRSGPCVWHLGDRVCTEPCGTCPADWTCELGAPGPDPIWMCVSRFPMLCLPCMDEWDCAPVLGDAAKCLSYGATGWFCGAECSDAVGCPPGTVCEADQCVAADGVCPCTVTASKLGLETACAAQGEAGACAGSRACGEDGLSPCDAPEPTPDVCDGVDNDCDGEVDTIACDDGDPCTLDTCAGAGGCVSVPDPVTCACSSDADCPPAPNACLGQMRCVHYDGKPTCSLDTTAAVECPDPGPCAVAACVPQTGACVTTPHADGTPCSIATACTFAGMCTAGVCAGGTTVACDDGNPCTDDGCDEAAGCIYTPNTAACDDGDACTEGDVCADGACDGEVVTCDDLDPCTADACDPTTGEAGCVHVPSDLACVDDNACTVDGCTAGVGCAFAPVAAGAACDDGNSCTTVDTCQSGACQGGAPLGCDDGEACTADACHPLLGCQHVGKSGKPCSDGDVCTVGDHCVAGSCVGGAANDCDDTNPCTIDGCLVDEGCVHLVADGLLCSDDNPCTVGDICAEGACVGVENPCEDGNSCTDSSCHPVAGCLHKPTPGGPCNDDNACTVGDSCKGPWCAGKPMKCVDDNPCTKDTCTPATGCAHLPLTGTPCTDGDACTASDACAAGVCVGLGAPQCNDGDPCTVDACDPAQGCVHTPSPTICCGNGVVESGEVCDDSNQQSGDGCSSDCTSTESCGNGVIDPGEVCDAPSFATPCLEGWFVCEDECQGLDATHCSSWCGDGVLDAESEACDGELFATECWEGTLACTPECKLVDTSGCQAWCGDGVANGPEECDGADLALECPVGKCTCSDDCTLGVKVFDLLDGVLDGTSSNPGQPLDPACLEPSTVCLDAYESTLGIVWVANATDNELVRFDAETGVVDKQIPSMGESPSRTAVVLDDGSVWVGNRGATCAGDPSCSNVVHFDADGKLICRADITGNVRALTIDAAGDVWAGSWLNHTMTKISGSMVDPKAIPPRCQILDVLPVPGAPYNAASDAKGNVWVVNNSNWSTSLNPAVQSLTLIHSETNTVVANLQPPDSFGCYQNYGLAVDAAGRVLIASYHCKGAFRYSPLTGAWEWHAIDEGTPRGIVADANAYSYTALSCATKACQPGHLRHVARITPDFSSHSVLDLGEGLLHPIGISIDHKGLLWAAGRYSNSIARVDIQSWELNPTIDIFPTMGAGPYPHRDMTGVQHLLFTNPTGTWSTIVDAEVADVTWETLVWSGIEEPGVTDLSARVRSAPGTGTLATAPWTPQVTESPADLATLLAAHHRFLEIEVQLSSSDPAKTPVLSSVALHWTKN